MNATFAAIYRTGSKKLPVILTSFLLFLSASAFANPLLYQQYTADPTACWFNNRMYIYCSHDITGQTGYSITNVYLMSSDDLVNWTDEGIPFRASDTSWAGLTYAPDTIFRNGFYYLYYGNGGGSIGVARSTSPTGPFTDPLGHSLVSNSTPGTGITYVFDPAAFIDDDGQAYLYFGGGGPGNARVIKLNSDMISVNGAAVSIPAPRYFEAPFMNKINGTYYFSYSTDFSASPAASIDYMTSSNPMTGFTHRGTVLNNPPNNCGNNDHASIVNIGSNYYIAYHNRALALQNGLTCGGNAVYQRSVNLDRAFVNSDGTLAVVTPTTAGVAALKNQNPFSTLRAVMMAKESGIQTQPCSEGGMNITGAANGTWTQVRNLDFSTGASSFTARVAGTVSGGTIQIHLDSTTGTLVGTLTVPNTGGTQTWQNASCPISGATGLHDVFFVYSGSGFNFESYSFTASNASTNTPTFTPTKTNTLVPPTATFTSTRTSTPIVQSTWRVNAGGPAYTDTLGNVWAADENFSGGSTIGQGTVTGTNDPTLYATQRFGGSFSYSFNVPTGAYQITLKLAETYSGDMSAGARIFNISVNGTAVVSNLDIFSQVGGNTADDKVINNVSPSGGVITITFASSGGTDANAVVEALQIIPQPATPTMTRTNTPVPPTATFTMTATKTNTPVPPTNTFTSTASFTSTSTRTNTPVPPTNTFTAVPPTATFTFTATDTSTPTASSTATRTNTPVPPTATNTTLPPTNTFTAVPPTVTDTAVPTDSSTPVPPTSTFTLIPPTSTFTAVPPTNTFTSVPPTVTFTFTVTRTNTPVPPTSTPTAVPPTATMTRTPTAVPPSATPSPTFTAVPPTATRTNTPVPPTATFTNTPIPPTATPTFTPTTVVSSGSLKVQLLSGVTSTTTNSPHPQIQVVNTGSGPLSLNNVTVRYWFNCDCTNQTEQAWVDWAGLMPTGTTVSTNVHVSVGSTTLGGQTNYVLYTFTGNMVLQPGQSIQVQGRFNKSDWSNMTQSNDWSFAANTSFLDDARVTGYISGGLVWGQEPVAQSAALVASSAIAFPNPSQGTGTTLSFTVGGSSTGTNASDLGSQQPLLVDPNAKITLSIYTLSQRLIWSQTLTGGAYGTTGEHEFYWNEKDLKGGGLANGIYLLKVTVESNGKTTTTYAKILILG